MISRRAFHSSLAATLLGGQTPRQKPNILFIASDDMNNALGCYGHPVVKTPNLDQLARRGVRFDRAYCQFPLCGPSRCSLLSGLRPDSSQVLANELAIRDKRPDALTLPQYFRQNGWRSVRIGKMYHMGVPTTVGSNQYDDPPSWDEATSPPGAEHRTASPDQRNITPKVGSGGAFHWISFPGEGKDQADDAAASLAIETIAKNRNQPFFLGLGFVRPHVPNVAPARFFDLYPKETLKPFQNPPGDLEDIPLASQLMVGNRAKDMGMSEADKQEALRGYFASISYMDWNVGRVLTALEREGLSGNTIVVFWGDHGWHLGEHHRWQKRSLFEGSSRVPLLVAAPGRKGNGRASKALVELVDLYPTLAELSGLAVPAHCEGQSFTRLLDNPARAWKTAAFTQLEGRVQGKDYQGRAIRTANHRYIRWTGAAPDEELYDLARDPHEFTNLARDPRNAALARKLAAQLDQGWKAARAL